MNTARQIAYAGLPTYKALEMKIVAMDEAQGYFRGYAAAFGNEDRVGDIIERGAFAKTLAEARAHKAASGGQLLMPLLWMHDTAKPVGIILSASEDVRGLAIEAKCDLNTELGRMVFSGIRNGYATGLSIGYDVVRATRDAKGIRHLTEIRLWEISAVTSGFAANEQALADPASVKSVVDPLRAAIERTMHAVVEDWRGRQRPPQTSAPTNHADDASAPPDPLTYRNYDHYEHDRAAWAARRLAQRYAGALADAQRADAVRFTQAVEAARDARLRDGTATPADAAAYARQHGRTFDGRSVAVTQTAEMIERARNAARTHAAEQE